MKNRIVKVDRTLLRGLIREAIEGREPGSPLFTPPSEKRPPVGKSFPAAALLFDDIIEDLTGRVQEYYMEMYDANDPSMEVAGGLDVWKYQVDAAVHELEERLLELFHVVEKRLIDGEFN